MRYLVLILGILFVTSSCGGIGNDVENNSSQNNNQEKENVILQVEAEPQPGGFIDGVYIKTAGSCDVAYSKLGIIMKTDGVYELYGLDGLESISVTPENGKGCFDIDDAACCLTQKESSVILTCAFKNEATCESIYEKDSEFDIETTFSSGKSISLDMRDLFPPDNSDSIEDISIVRVSRNITFNVFGTKSYVSFLESDMSINRVADLFEETDLNLYGTFIDRERKTRLTGLKDVSHYNIIASDFSYDTQNHVLYWFSSRLSSDEDPIKQTGSTKLIANSVFSPKSSNGFLLWTDIEKKKLFFMPEDKNVLYRSYSLPVNEGLIDFTYMENNLYALIQNGEVLEVMSRPKIASGKWISMWLNYQPDDIENVKDASILSKNGILAISMRGDLNVYICQSKSWQHFNFNKDDKIIHLSMNGYFASDGGRFYVMKEDNQFYPFLTVDVFVETIDKRFISDILINKVLRYCETDNRIFFLIPSKEVPEKPRFIGWITSPKP